LFAVCAGVFGTTLSQEYAIAASAFNLSNSQLLDLSEQAVQHCFCSEQEQQQLLKHFHTFRHRQQQQEQQPEQSVEQQPEQHAVVHS
jgi:adenosine deaminase